MKLDDITPRLLLGPGPSPVESRILDAMARPTVGHLDPQFLSIMDEVNATGEAFISQTVLEGAVWLRMSIGNLRTTERGVRRVWELLLTSADRLAGFDGPPRPAAPG